MHAEELQHEQDESRPGTFMAVCSMARSSSLEKSSMCRKWCPFLGGDTPLPVKVAVFSITAAAALVARFLLAEYTNRRLSCAGG
jgi:hypothetical protein